MKRFLKYIKEAELGFPGDKSDKLYYSGGKEVKPKMSAEDEEHWSHHSLMPQPNEPGTNKSRYNVGHLRQLANMHPENHPRRLHFERKYGHLGDNVSALPDQHRTELESDFHFLARSIRTFKPEFDAARLATQAEKETSEMGQRPLLNHVELIGRVLKESMDTLFPFERIRDETGSNGRRYINHRITVPDGSTITVKKTIPPESATTDRELSVKFGVDNPEEGKFVGDLTGKNKYKFGILSTVSHITQTTAKEHGIDTVTYSVGSEPKEKRERVYDRIAQKVGAKRLPGYGIPTLKLEHVEKIGKLINEIFEFDMDSVRHDGDLAHYHSHLDRLAYQHGAATRHLDKIKDEDPLDRSRRKRKAEDRVEKIGEQFRDVAGMANMAGHDPHKQGHAAFRNTGSLDPKFYKDTSHIDEGSRQDAFSRTHGGEQYTAKRNDRENLVRFKNKPGPWHMGYATHDLSIS